MDKQPMYCSRLQIADVSLCLAATARGLALVSLPYERMSDDVEYAVGTRFPSYQSQYDEAVLRPFAQALQSYFSGASRGFDVPLDLHGTPFQRSVWLALGEVPYGAVCSYAAIAARIGNPKAVRAVGAAIGRNPVPIVVPCHRIIGKNGTLTGYRGGLAFKERLLRLEGNDQFQAVGHARFAF